MFEQTYNNPAINERPVSNPYGQHPSFWQEGGYDMSGSRNWNGAGQQGTGQNGSDSGWNGSGWGGGTKQHFAN